MPWTGSEVTAKPMHPVVTTTQEMPLTPYKEVMQKESTLYEAIFTPSSMGCLGWSSRVHSKAGKHRDAGRSSPSASRSQGQDGGKARRESELPARVEGSP